VSTVRILLAVLICACPLILLYDGLIAHGLVAGAVAVGLALAARSLRPGEAGFLTSLIPLPTVLAILPALWIVIQVLPLPFLAHPFWMSAAAALGHTIAGSISIDTGAGVIVLGQYLSMLGVALLSAAVGVDRRRAPWILFALMGACSAVSFIGTVYEFVIPGAARLPLVQSQVTACAGLGVIIAGAALVRVTAADETQVWFVAPSRPLALCAAALAICSAVLILNGTGQAIFAFGCGLAVFLTTFVIRRWKIGVLGITASAVLILSFIVVIVAFNPTHAGSKLPLTFATDASDLWSVSARILQDSPLAGTGAGTFAAVFRVYREMGNSAPDPTASTAAAAIAIELGRPMLLIIVIAAAIGIAALLMATLERGRDSFYPAMGATCLLSLLLLAFVDSALIGAAPVLIAAAAIGLAIAQSKSRRTQLNDVFPATSVGSSSTPGHSGFRITMVLFAAALGAYAVWLLVPEFFQSGGDGLPTSEIAAAEVAKRRPDAALAARVGAIRGELWGQYAYTYASLLWPNGSAHSDLLQSLSSARATLERAVELAPGQPSAWLLLAGLAQDDNSPNTNNVQDLKMSYYTGPSEYELVPLRLRIAVRLLDSSDAELQDMMRRDLRLLASRHQTPVIVAVYAGAPAGGKRFIEQSLGEIDPSILPSLSAQGQTPR
jgi:hypothetical protein